MKNYFLFTTVISTLTLSSPLIAEDSTIDDIITNATILADGRIRYEFADFQGFERDANALTFHGRFGFETAKYKDFSLLVEGDFTRSLGIDNFNSTTNGQTEFPVIADPNSERLNRFQLNYTGLAGTKISIGRQRIKLDDDRFIGNVGFRQNEQTYDAVRFTNTSIENLSLDYTYAWQVNRIFGSNSVNGRTDANNHFINAKYKSSIGDFTAYAYLIDLDAFQNLSNQTFGGNFSTKQKVTDTSTVFFKAEYATQKDFGNSPDNFSLDYYLIEGGTTVDNLTLKARYESLEGDGNRGFATPLATLHKFQGFADVFLSTPANGLEDLQFSAAYSFKDVFGLGPVKVTAAYHDFNSENIDFSLGNELDFTLSVPLTKGVNLAVKYADFNSDSLRNVNRFFFAIAFKY
ncbi:hypothetical protein [Kordiimonas sp. SCSIO 12610]|uniref:hypothetical protein n=1 Tax=Kordiimonas sp. SCSIO 12610 TaxID=2829597 RepID=UPI00210EAD8E|nr:hypothetical protein [Kordiimonas sp. SCSIO 12610]UTW55350.1 hypothetical protein KFF44_00205 [Kordiimonas sp. SCSIO 12610]